MDSRKINSSSLIDLKAELYRKQEEYKVQKLASQDKGYIKGKSSTSQKKTSIWNKKNKGVSERAGKDYEEKLEEENVFERSKKSLESKAKLYEKIANSSEVPEEDGSNLFLVDFQKKVIDDKQERMKKEKEARERQEEEEDRKISELPVPEPETPDEEWVDYTDCLGRSRRCLKADLPSLQQQDTEFYNSKILPKEKAARSFQELRDKSDVRDLMSSDMYREAEREKWEKEEADKMAAEKEGPIHYGDVLHNEIRTHGVAFYKFDTDESRRQEQMEDLMKLREETKDERSKTERIKAKRKAALAARLSKVKQRKREKLGLPEEDEEAEEEIGPKAEEAVETEKVPEVLKRDDDWRKTVTSTREWDKGKQKLPERSEQEWLEKQRKERLEEFAPPSFYYVDQAPSGQTRKNGSSKLNNNSDQMKEQCNSESGDSIKDIIGKQLSDIRSELDKNTSLFPEVDREIEKTNNTQSSVASVSDVNQVQPQQCSSDQTMAACQSFNFTPPPVYNTNSFPSVNLQVPPPPLPTGVPINLQVPPPPVPTATPISLQVSPPPVHTGVPTNLQVPPPPLPTGTIAPPPMPVSMPVPAPMNGPTSSTVDFSVPPPTWHVTQQGDALLENTNNSTTPSVCTARLNYVPANETKTKFVPRMSVLDTRFMESE